MMTRRELQQLEDRWRTYIDRFRTDDAFHPMQQLKIEHTLRVAADARTIAERMSWPEPENNLAEAIGLFHDIARFPQFAKYKTFSDADSVDHGDFGARTLETEGLLAGLADEPLALILHSVQYHNKKDLPCILTAHEEKHLRLIRDADRIDIFFVCWNMVASGAIHDHPEVMMNIDFDAPPSKTVLEQFDRGEAIDYRAVQSMADRFVLQLSWMHDLSYDASRCLVRERGILEKFMDVLPVKTPHLLRCFEMTESFLAEA
jgi:hypothetical protein